MSPEERASVLLIHLALNELVFTHPKVLSRRVLAWDPVEGLLTPKLVREIVRSKLLGLGRAREVEHYVLARLKINGAEFFAWARDPGGVLQTTAEVGAPNRFGAPVGGKE